MVGNQSPLQLGACHPHCYYVYALRSQATGLVKIGRTKHPSQRVLSLRSELGDDLCLIALIPTFDMALEGEIVLALRPYREANREWFRISEHQLAMLIAKALSQYRELTPAIIRNHAIIGERYWSEP